MIENAEQGRGDERDVERGRENQTPDYEEGALPGNSNSHSLFSRSVRNHQREVREGPYDFQVHVKGEGEKRDGRKEAKIHRRGNRDGRKR